MDIVLAVLGIAVAGTLALYAFAVIGSCVIVGTLTVVIYILPWLLVQSIILALRGMVAGLYLGIAAIKKLKLPNKRDIAIPQGNPRWQEQARDRARTDTQKFARVDGWNAACKLLGLPKAGFTKQELTRAYRKAILAAHPDLGGTHAHAKSINVARDLIRAHKGWV